MAEDPSLLLRAPPYYFTFVFEIVGGSGNPPYDLKFEFEIAMRGSKQLGVVLR